MNNKDFSLIYEGYQYQSDASRALQRHFLRCLAVSLNYQASACSVFGSLNKTIV